MTKGLDFWTLHAVKKRAAACKSHVALKETALLSYSPMQEDGLGFVNQLSWDFSIGNGGLLPRKWDGLCSTRGQPQWRWPLHHLHLLSEQELGRQGTLG